MKSLYWRTNACQPDSFFFAASSLGPYFAARSCTSVEVNPAAGSTPSRRATSSTVAACHSISLCDGSANDAVI